MQLKSKLNVTPKESKVSATF